MRHKEKMQDNVKEAIDQERSELLKQFEAWLELPVLFLGFVWLVLLIIELVYQLSQALQTVVYFIWIVFIIDFILRFFLAPHKTDYLKKNWLTAVSLIIPALRVFRIFQLVRILRAARAVRGIQLLRLLSSVNRGMRSLQRKLRKRSIGYVLLLTLIVTFAGAAGMYFFELSDPAGKGFTTYGDALWWTAMVITTFGSEFWPRTTEGRMLGFLLSVYAFTIFGYITATLASYFIGKDAEDKEEEIAGEKSITELKAEVTELHRKLNLIIEKLNSDTGNDLKTEK